jgi:hypothetical protein
MEPTKDRPQMNSESDGATTLSKAGAFGSTRRDHFRLALGSAVFLLLTASILIYQFFQIDHSDESLTWSGLRFEYLFLMLLCLPFDTLATGLRIWLV